MIYFLLTLLRLLRGNVKKGDKILIKHLYAKKLLHGETPEKYHVVFCMFCHTLDFFANLTGCFRFFLHKIYIQSMDKCLTILMKWSNFQQNGLKLTFFTKCWNDENMKAFTHLGQARPIEQNLVCNNEISKYFREEKLNFFEFSIDLFLNYIFDISKKLFWNKLFKIFLQNEIIFSTSQTLPERSSFSYKFRYLKREYKNVWTFFFGCNALAMITRRGQGRWTEWKRNFARDQRLNVTLSHLCILLRWLFTFYLKKGPKKLIMFSCNFTKK